MNEMDRQAIRNLQERVGKLERELNQSKQKELEWALNQFRYMEKTPNLRKAFEIIERELKE